MLGKEGGLAGSGGTDQRAIVLFSASDLLEGIEFDAQLTRPKKIYGITSWVFYIRQIDEGRSRLLIRVRAELGPTPLKIIASLVFGTGDAVFERTILVGIKSRAANFEKLNSRNGQTNHVRSASVSQNQGP